VYRNGSFRAFQVSGESMQSTLYEGDWVICRYVERWDRDIRDTYVHVVVTEEAILVKRVNNRLSERGQLTLHSDNPAYPVQFVDGEQVREVWVAVGKLSRQFVNPRYDVNVELARHSATLEDLLSRIERLEKDHRPKGY
jgi:phage repressor protein C with HTH and peptisase S24 domain